MAESYPVQVFQALMEVGRSLTGTRPGWDGSYPNEITVIEGSPDGDAVRPPLPILAFEELGGTSRIETSAGAQVQVRHQMEVRVTGYVESTEDVGAPTWRMRLWDDFVTAFYATDKLGGLISSFEEGPRRTVTRTAAPRSEFEYDVTLHFFEKKTLEATP